MSIVRLLSSAVFPGLAILTTLGLAFLWSGEEKSSLFWFNLCYGVFLEVVFFGYIWVLRSDAKRMTGAFYSVMGTFAALYILVGFALLVASLFIPFKIYATAVAVITVAWLVIGALIAETDERHKADEEITKEKNRELMKRK